MRFRQTNRPSSSAERSIGTARPPVAERRRADLPVCRTGGFQSCGTSGSPAVPGSRGRGRSGSRRCDRLASLRHGGARGGFTLAEVLAALVFMAIVIPVAVQGLRVANLAGQVGERKAVAIRVAERALNELVVTRQWQTSAQNGSTQEGPVQYRWVMRLEPWNQGALRLLTVQVTFPVQGQDYDVRLSTLVDTTSP